MSFSFKSHADTGTSIEGHNTMVVEDGKHIPLGGYAHEFVHKTLRIDWQSGPVNREAGEKPNGAFVEDVLDVSARRLEFYQESDFAHESNAKAIALIREAIGVLNERRDERKARGVLGKNEQ